MSEWVTAWGKSPACLIDECEECETPNECDCDCHLEDPPVDTYTAASHAMHAYYNRSWGY
jgi:hypothetical protein